MNKLTKIILLLTCSLCCFAAQAQDFSRNPQLQQRIIQAKLFEIKKALQLSEDKAKELAPIYQRYEMEKSKVQFPRQEGLLRMNPDSLNTEEADKLITAQLDNAIRMSTIRREYYNEFKKVLTPHQVVQLYKSEAQLNRKVMMELRRRMNNRMNR